jgi:hypothetical protein
MFSVNFFDPVANCSNRALGLSGGAAETAHSLKVCH